MCVREGRGLIEGGMQWTVVLPGRRERPFWIRAAQSPENGKGVFRREARDAEKTIFAGTGRREADKWRFTRGTGRRKSCFRREEKNGDLRGRDAGKANPQGRKKAEKGTGKRREPLCIPFPTLNRHVLEET